MNIDPTGHAWYNPLTLDWGEIAKGVGLVITGVAAIAVGFFERGHQWIHWHTEMMHSKPINNFLRFVWEMQREDSNMNWNEFIERYLINHEEFRFKYKNYIIDLLYSSGGTKYAYYISEYIENETIFSKIKNRNKYLKFDEFDSLQELLEKFSINNNSFQEIWNELEWK